MSEHQTLNLVAVFMTLLFVASLVAIVCKRIKFPFTILLVIIGLALGWGARAIPLLHPLLLFTLSPEVVLFVFLPVLIFESALNLNVRALIKNLPPILTLAIPGLLISTATVGTLMHFALALPWGISLLFGTLISATDPVAVISLFREMGAPKRLTLLVEGESLFNDGTALVLFKLILGVILAGHFSAATVTDGIITFFIVFMGGVAVGTFLGLLFSKIIEIVDNDRLVEVTLTTILAHTAFLTAEHFLHVSGVMATVAAGLVLGSYGKTKISPPVHKHMETFWEYFAFVCNSLIFLLVGLSIDPSLFLANYQAILWGAVAILVARSAAIYSLFPVVHRLEGVERVSGAFQTVIFWGGLRGALAIVMALSLPPELEQKSFILVLTLAVVLFTLLVNGLTIKPLMTALGLDKYSLKESYERSQAKLLATQDAVQEMDAFSHQGAIQANVLDARKRAYQETIESLTEALDEFRHGDMLLEFKDESEIVLRHCLMIEKKQYEKLFEEGSLHEDNLRDLDHHIEIELDRLKEGQEVNPLKENPSLFGRLEELVLCNVGKLFFLTPLLRRYKTRKIAARYEMARARYIASDVVLQENEKMGRQGTVSSEAGQKAKEIYQELHDNAQLRMDTIRAEFPEYVEKVEGTILERFCLSTELETFQNLCSQGAISEKVMAEMQEQIDYQLHRMRTRPVEELLMPPVQLMQQVPCFNELKEDDLVRLASHLNALSFLPGEEIVREGAHGDSLFLIGRGQVDVSRTVQDKRIHMAHLKAGDFFGEIALLHPQPRIATVQAATPCTLLELSRGRLLPYLKNAPHLRKVLENAYQNRIQKTESASDFTPLK